MSGLPSHRISWRRFLALVLPLCVLAGAALAGPRRIRTRGRRSGGNIVPSTNAWRRNATGAIDNGSSAAGRHAASNTPAGGRFAASRNSGGSGGGNTPPPRTPVERSNATHGRHEANLHRAEGGGRGTSGANGQDVHRGIFGVTTGLRNGLDGTSNVITTHRITPNGIMVVRNQPGAYLSRGGAFQQAKRIAGVPANAHPRRVFKEKLRPNDQPNGGAPERYSRVYEFDGPNGTTIQIREHSYGHVQDMAGPHFNVDYVRDGKFVTSQYLRPGADRHFYFVR
jgi:hypothetical protein